MSRIRVHHRISIMAKKRWPCIVGIFAYCIENRVLQDAEAKFPDKTDFKSGDNLLSTLLNL